MTAPCKDCKDRAPGCHTTCERYSKYKDAKAQENYNRYIANITPDGAQRSMWREIRRKKRSG